MFGTSPLCSSVNAASWQLSRKKNILFNTGKCIKRNVHRASKVNHLGFMSYSFLKLVFYCGDIRNEYQKVQEIWGHIKKLEVLFDTRKICIIGQEPRERSIEDEVWEMGKFPGQNQFCLWTIMFLVRLKAFRCVTSKVAFVFFRSSRSTKTKVDTVGMVFSSYTRCFK